MDRRKLIERLKIIGGYGIVFITIIVLSFAEIVDGVAPFIVAWMFATLFLPVNKYFVAVSVFLCGLFVNTDRHSVIASLWCVGIFLVTALVCHKVMQRNNRLPRLASSPPDVRVRWKKIWTILGIIFTGFILSQGLGVWFAFGDGKEGLYKALVGVLAGCIFLGCCLIFVNAMKVRRARIPWTVDQKICLGVFVVVFSLGLGAFRFDVFDVHKFVALLIIFVGIVVLDQKGTLVVAVCLGLGLGLENLDLTWVAIYSLMAVAAIAFRNRVKLYSVAAVVATDVVLGYYFGAYIEYDFFSMLPVLVAAAVILVLPYSLGRYFDFSKGMLGGFLVSKNTINRNRAGVYGRLNNLAGVFNEMQHIYRNLTVGAVDQDMNTKYIANVVSDRVCSGCRNYISCRKDTVVGAHTLAAIEKLSMVGVHKGGVNFLDITADMNMRCSQINSVLECVNETIRHMKAREAANATMDAGKVLMAGMLQGVAKVITTLAEDVGATVVFDERRAKAIKDELLARAIVASDVLLSKSSLDVITVSVLVGRADAQNRAIEQVISRVCGHKMQVESIDDGETAGFAIVTVRTSPRFSLTFGVAQVSKDLNAVCGDTFSFLKISHDKTMMAVCDGMGAGLSAERASVLAMSLVENFYKADFPNEIIMTSVNQLLASSGQEIFSALDIAVFNLVDGWVNFVKVGACDGFIKRHNEVEVVEAGSLPMGVLEEMVPKVTRAVLIESDMVVLCSDGVADNFGNRSSLASFINNLNLDCPQKVADEIMRECLNRATGVANDDCTVVVGRIITK